MTTMSDAMYERTKNRILQGDGDDAGSGDTADHWRQMIRDCDASLARKSATIAELLTLAESLQEQLRQLRRELDAQRHQAR